MNIFKVIAQLSLIFISSFSSFIYAQTFTNFGTTPSAPPANNSQPLSADEYKKMVNDLGKQNEKNLSDENNAQIPNKPSSPSLPPPTTTAPTENNIVTFEHGTPNNPQTPPPPPPTITTSPNQPVITNTPSTAIPTVPPPPPSYNVNTSTGISPGTPAPNNATPSNQIYTGFGPAPNNKPNTNSSTNPNDNSGSNKWNIQY